MVPHPNAGYSPEGLKSNRQPGELQRLIEVNGKESGEYGELLNQLEVCINRISDGTNSELGPDPCGKPEQEYAPGYLSQVNELNRDMNRRNQRLRMLIERCNNHF